MHRVIWLLEGETVKDQAEIETAQAISNIFLFYNKKRVESLTSMYDLSLTSSLHVHSFA
jgi:hypothetical protein